MVKTRDLIPSGYALVMRDHRDGNDYRSAAREVRDGVAYVDTPAPPTTATISMSNFSKTLQKLVKNISEQNYDETLPKYRFWLDLGTAHGHINKDQVDADAWQIIWSNPSANDGTQLIHPTLGLFFRFVGDMEDKIESQCASDYHKKRCTGVVVQCPLGQPWVCRGSCDPQSHPAVA